MSRKSPVHSSLLLDRIPKEIKASFKAACAKRGVTMKEAIVQFMKKFKESV